MIWFARRGLGSANPAHGLSTQMSREDVIEKMSEEFRAYRGTSKLNCAESILFGVTIWWRLNAIFHTISTYLTISFLYFSENNSQRTRAPTTTRRRRMPTASRKRGVPSTFPPKAWTPSSWGIRNFVRSTIIRSALWKIKCCSNN